MPPTAPSDGERAFIAEVRGTLGESLEQVRTELRKEAAAEGWSFAEGESGPDVLVFKKGTTATSWGSELSVALEAASDSQTHVTVITGETWAISDWGRGSRAARKLLKGIGAELDVAPSLVRP
jgi:hypothetical protein